MQKKGIDISRYQGTPDFAKLKNYEIIFIVGGVNYDVR